MRHSIYPTETLAKASLGLSVYMNIEESSLNCQKGYNAASATKQIAMMRAIMLKYIDNTFDVYLFGFIVSVSNMSHGKMST